MPRVKLSTTERILSPEKSTAILKAAMQVFLANGYVGTSMASVAATAGVSKATVYSHFGDKEKLFAALMQHFASTKFSTLFAVAQNEPDVQIALKKMANQAIDDMVANQQMQCFVRLVYGESGRFPKLGEIFVENYFMPAVEHLAEFLHNHPQSYLPDPQVTARVIVGSLVHFIQIQYLLYGEKVMPMERDRFLEVLFEQFSNHVLSKRADIKLETV